MRKVSGFTLIELIVVIVILGILAATALPKFINMSSDARIASLKGTAGAIRSAVGLAQAKYMVAGKMDAETVTISGTTTAAVAKATGIPTAAGIQSLITISDHTIDGTDPVTFVPSGGGDACRVEYAPDTGEVTVVDTGC